MSLNPSTGIAARTNPGKRVFPNLARSVPSQVIPDDLRKAVFKEVDDVVRAELVEAGILTGDENGKTTRNYMEADFIREVNGQFKKVPTAIFAAKYGWKFERRWYYYVAQGYGIPPDVAEEFHKTWGTQVRVEGHCGCPSPLEWCHGFAVGSYHIDTQEGLNAFVKLLESIWRP